jgi:hypothetical protein
VTDPSLNDATLPPRPEGGWSSRMRTVRGALVVPAGVPDMIQPAGVFDADGAYVREGVLWRGRALMVEPPRPQPEDHLPGHWIWGGVLLNHFGHFLTESTGRLWGYSGKADGILFISKRGEADEAGEIALQSFHRLFFDLLGIDIQIQVLTRPTTVERLDVPGQGFGIGPISAGTAEFRAFVRDRFGRDVPAAGSDLLYVSRSELGATRGGVLEETRIESFLSAYGYDIFHPQKHSLTDQIARYKAARRIVALDGSALHLVAMLCKPDQEVAVIRRRNSDASDTIVRHLASFMGRAPAVIDVIKQDWVRSDRRRADRFSVGELDFAALAQRLGELGFVPRGAVMPALTDDEARTAIAAVEAKLQRGKLRFEPLPPGTKRKPAAEEAPRKRPADPKPTARMTPRRAARLAARAAAAKG